MKTHRSSYFMHSSSCLCPNALDVCLVIFVSTQLLQENMAYKLYPEFFTSFKWNRSVKSQKWTDKCAALDVIINHICNVLQLIKPRNFPIFPAHFHIRLQKKQKGLWNRGKGLEAYTELLILFLYFHFNVNSFLPIFCIFSTRVKVYGRNFFALFLKVM